MGYDTVSLSHNLSSSEIYYPPLKPPAGNFRRGFVVLFPAYASQHLKIRRMLKICFIQIGESPVTGGTDRCYEPAITGTAKDRLEGCNNLRLLKRRDCAHMTGRNERMHPIAFHKPSGFSAPAPAGTSPPNDGRERLIFHRMTAAPRMVRSPALPSVMNGQALVPAA